MLQHVEEEHKDIVFSCAICDKCFSSAVTCAEHMKCHKVKYNPSEPLRVEKVVGNITVNTASPAREPLRLYPIPAAVCSPRITRQSSTLHTIAANSLKPTSTVAAEEEPQEDSGSRYPTRVRRSTGECLQSSATASAAAASQGHQNTAPVPATPAAAAPSSKSVPRKRSGGPGKGVASSKSGKAAAQKGSVQCPQCEATFLCL